MVKVGEGNTTIVSARRDEVKKPQGQQETKGTYQLQQGSRTWTVDRSDRCDDATMREAWQGLCALTASLQTPKRRVKVTRREFEGERGAYSTHITDYKGNRISATVFTKGNEATSVDVSCASDRIQFKSDLKDDIKLVASALNTYLKRQA